MTKSPTKGKESASKKDRQANILELMGIEIRYAATTSVVKNLSLNVKRGSVVTILGANGAGKSSVLKRVSGLIPAQPPGGKILFEGSSIKGKRPEYIVRAGISYVPEERELFGQLTVYENLKMGAYIRKDRKAIKEDRERIMNYFPILKERRKQIAGTLSGGEQQMLAIARGLMSRPKLLMLDEPSLGLAPMLVRDIFDIISEINREGMTILIIEQNANMALKIADFGYVMETGVVVLKGSAEQLRKNEMLQEFYLGGRDE